jgi:DNA modification methylase
MNQLYYSDNLDVLRRHIDDESIDLVYLDPPFNSNATYNVLFAERDGTQAASQIKAFEDSWKWDREAARAYEDIVEVGGRVSQAMQAFRTLLGDSNMLAYLAMMAPRLLELRRVLKASGSIYLHCDPTASHYLKLLMDAVFGPEHFQNEIVWKRTSAHSSAKRYGPVHDIILFFSRSTEVRWIGGYQGYEEEYVRQRFGRGGDRPWKDADLTGAGVRHGETGQAWRGFDVTAKGRHWAYPPAELDKLDTEGRIYWPKKKGGWPRERVFLEAVKGIPLQDVWTDIFPINSQAQERLGYPTQKPEALLERIISASSSEGDVVLDPFCGCGTMVIAAQKLNRRWIGIDITNLAITLIRSRLTDTFAGSVEYEVIGEPVSLPDATRLAHDDPYQFQWWALGLVGARPVEEKKGADRGIDGRIYFHMGDNRTHQIVLSVKAGHVNVSHVRDLRGVMEREHAEMGVLISLEEPTAPMRKEAASAGFFASPWRTHARLQLITVEDLLTGKTVDRPPVQTSMTFRRAPKATPKIRETRTFGFGAPDPDQAV